LELVGEYIDEGVSGARAKRPALDRLLADARRRQFDAVLVWKLDRLGRSLQHLLTILGEFDEIGVRFVSLDDAIDTSTAAGRLFMQMRGAFAEYELAQIRERTRAGVAAARRRGRRLGRPRAYLNVDRARELLAQGQSLASVATELGVSRRTLRRRVGEIVPAPDLTSPRETAPPASL
jgi:DNA invertase Pin-like site-specific DNA recombinase